MKGKLLLALVFVLVLSLALSSVAFGQDEEEVLFRVDVRNNTDQLVTLSLVAQEGFTAYVLNVSAGASQVFTIKEGTYNHTTFACGDSATGTVAVTQQLRLVFTPCFGDAVNAGEPTLEKIQLPDVPEGGNWKYQFD